MLNRSQSQLARKYALVSVGIFAVTACVSTLIFATPKGNHISTCDLDFDQDAHSLVVDLVCFGRLLCDTLAGNASGFRIWISGFPPM